MTIKPTYPSAHDKCMSYILIIQIIFYMFVDETGALHFGLLVYKISNLYLGDSGVKRR